MTMNSPNLCVINLKGYGLISGASTPQYIGGIETHLTALSRGLARHGVDVSAITYDHGQDEGVQFDGVRVHKAYDREGGVPVVRFLHPRWTGLCNAMKRADADVYLQMGAGCETGQAAMWCRRHGKTFIFAAASDSDCMRTNPLLGTGREKRLYRYGLRAAAKVISQTPKQQDLLNSEFGVDSRVFAGFCSEPSSGLTRWADARNGSPPHVLWIGRVSPEKRPELLLDVARRLPECRFDVIGDSNTGQSSADEFRDAASKLEHVVVHGKVSAEQLEQLFSDGAILLSTSGMEGFPVTFIEAWSRGIPVVATTDPEGRIGRHEVGFTDPDPARLADAVKQLITEDERWRRVSLNARDLYLQVFTLDAAVERYKELITQVSDEGEHVEPPA